VAATFVSTGNGERELETHEKGRRMKARILRFLFARVAVLMVGSCWCGWRLSKAKAEGARARRRDNRVDREWRKRLGKS
jgi:hypothetical protein